MTSLTHRGFIHLGMDVSRDSISVALLPPDCDVAEIDKISSDEESVRRLIKRWGRPEGLWACYEAGPTGCDLYRLLGSMGVRCDVVAPSLVPKGRGDMIKPTNATLGALLVCTAPASSPPSECPADNKRRCAICVAPGATWCKT